MCPLFCLVDFVQCKTKSLTSSYDKLQVQFIEKCYSNLGAHFPLETEILRHNVPFDYILKGHSYTLE